MLTTAEFRSEYASLRKISHAMEIFFDDRKPSHRLNGTGEAIPLVWSTIEFRKVQASIDTLGT